MAPTSPSLPPGLPRTVALLALGAAGLRVVDALLNAPRVLADWHAYYRAAVRLRSGEDLYGEAKELLARNSYDFWLQTDGQYVYPPLLAFLVTPLTALDIGKGGDVWLVLLALATTGLVLTIARLLDRPARPETLTPLALPVLGAVPLLLGMRYGQVDIVLALLLALALLAYRRSRDGLAGVLLGAAVAIKPIVVLVGLFYLWKGRWVTLATAAATGLALGLGPFLWLGPAALADWLAVAAYFGGGDYLTYPSNQSARGWLLRAFAGGPRHTPLLVSPELALALWLAVAAGALALIVCRVRRQPARDARDVEEYALVAALALLAAPLSEDIHYVALLLPLAVLGDRLAWSRTPGWWTALALAACVYFLQPWLDFAYNRGGTDLRRLLAGGAYLYGLVLVVAALASTRRAARDTS